MKLAFVALLITCAFHAAPARADEGFFQRLSQAALELQKQGGVLYDSRYVKIGYPGGDVPPDRGVCTDVVIRSYRRLGVDLQVEVHEDMRVAFPAYPHPKQWELDAPDPNIDHRRVLNLMTFFARRGAALPISDRSADYRPGDLVAWDLGGGTTHIGIVAPGPMIVHHIGGLGPTLDDVLFAWKIIGHYRYGKIKSPGLKTGALY